MVGTRLREERAAKGATQSNWERERQGDKKRDPEAGTENPQKENDKLDFIKIRNLSLSKVLGED